MIILYQIKRFIDCHVPVNLCNFQCDYCTVGQWRAIDGKGPEKYTLFKYPVEQMVAGLSKERMGGICSINLCGNGETFLHPQLLELVELLLKEGHFVSIVTNGTVTKSLDYLYNLDYEMRSRIFIKFSFHYIELKKKNLLEKYFENVHRAHKAGLSLTVELVASDSNVELIDEIKNVCMEEFGVLCHLTDPRANTTNDIRHLTEMPMDEHIRVWSQFNSRLFDYRQATWGQNRKSHFCYGGVWSFNLDLGTGRLKQCYRDAKTVQYIFENVEEPIHFVPRGHFCSLPHCFNSHVFDCHAGAVPDIKSPEYIELRNRVLPDGTEWVKEPYKSIYSVKVSENHQQYTEEEKIFVDGIMALSSGVEPSVDFKSTFENYLSNITTTKRVELYEDNDFTKWIKENISNEFFEKKSNEKIIIVTSFSDFAQLKQKLEKETDAVIVSIVDVPYLK